MFREFKIDYDFDADLLYCYDGKRHSKGSIELGSLVIDFEKQGAVVGLEVFDASGYLSELTNRKVTKKALQNITKAQFSSTEKKGTLILKLILPLEKENVPATIAIQDMLYRSPLLARATA